MEIDRVSLGGPPSFLRGLDLDPGPSVSVSIRSCQGSALEVDRFLLDLGRPPEADPDVDALGSQLCPVTSSGGAESTLALALDLKGAFNAVLPGVLLRQLSELDVPGRIVNFVNFLTTRRMLHFSHGNTSPTLCGVGVPQGGVLSLILFSIHRRRVNKILPAEVRAAMYEDLFLYSRHSDPQQALLQLERAMGSLVPWLRSLGLSISIPKCQICLFTRGVVLEVDGVRLHCCDTLKYLGLVLDARVTWLQHVKYVAGRALRTVGLLRVLSRVS